MAYQGYYKPKKPEKYDGDPSKIIYRSSWELKFMIWLDNHSEVIKWSSEEFCIPYLSPLDGKVHRYFPDFKVKQRNKNGVIETIIIEVKPDKQTREPIPQKKKTKRYITEVYTWGVNKAKWKAAEKYCAERQWKFQIMTEHHLGIK